MGLLYVNENGATIGVEANQCTVKYKDGMKRLIPIESWMELRLWDGHK